MAGAWKINNLGYQKRVGQVVDILDSVCTECNVQTPAPGCDLWKHLYREGNKRADLLTWELRNKPNTNRKHVRLENLCNTCETLIAVRGSFDGGVSSIGSGGDWWLDGEFADTASCMLARQGCDCSVPVCRRPLAEEAFGLHPGATVTECELEAAERLASAAAEIIRYDRNIHIFQGV